MTSGLRSKPLFKIAQLIAASPTLQSACAAAYGVPATATAALPYVHILEASDELGDDGRPIHPRPRVMVKLGSDFTTAKQGPGDWNESGSVDVCFEFPPADPKASRSENLLAFADKVGEILKECSGLAGQGNAGDGESYLNVVEFTSQNGAPEYCDMQRENGVDYLIDDYTARYEG